jgi:hypothetical protein
MGEERSIIDDVFLVSLFKVLSEHPNMTATQVIELVNEKGMLVAPTLGRQHTEYVGGLVERELDLLAEMRMLDRMPPRLREAMGHYEVTDTSPLSLAASAARRPASCGPSSRSASSSTSLRTRACLIPSTSTRPRRRSRASTTCRKLVDGRPAGRSRQAPEPRQAAGKAGANPGCARASRDDQGPRRRKRSSGRCSSPGRMTETASRSWPTASAPTCSRSRRRPGEAILADLAVFCRANETCVVPGDRDRTYVLEGRREVYLRIRDHLDLTIDQLVEKYTRPAQGAISHDRTDPSDAAQSPRRRRPPAGDSLAHRRRCRSARLLAEQGPAARRSENLRRQADRALRGTPRSSSARRPISDQAAEADAKPEEISAFRQRLGVPAEAKDYDFTSIKDAAGQPLAAPLADALRAASHEAGVPKDAAAKVAAAVVKHLDGVRTTQSTLTSPASSPRSAPSSSRTGAARNRHLPVQPCCRPWKARAGSASRRRPSRRSKTKSAIRQGHGRHAQGRQRRAARIFSSTARHGGSRHAHHARGRHGSQVRTDGRQGMGRAPHRRRCRGQARIRPAQPDD